MVRVGVYPRGHRRRGRVWTRRCRRRRTSLGGSGNRRRRWQTFKPPPPSPPLHWLTTGLASQVLGMDLPDGMAAWVRVWAPARCWEAAEWGRISGRRGGRGGNRSRVYWSGWDAVLLGGECSEEGVCNCPGLSGKNSISAHAVPAIQLASVFSRSLPLFLSNLACLFRICVRDMFALQQSSRSVLASSSLRSPASVRSLARSLSSVAPSATRSLSHSNARPHLARAPLAAKMGQVRMSSGMGESTVSRARCVCARPRAPRGRPRPPHLFGLFHSLSRLLCALGAWTPCNVTCTGRD